MGFFVLFGAFFGRNGVDFGQKGALFGRFGAPLVFSSIMRVKMFYRRDRREGKER
jgi:hypothetical protein